MPREEAKPNRLDGAHAPHLIRNGNASLADAGRVEQGNSHPTAEPDASRSSAEPANMAEPKDGSSESLHERARDPSPESEQSTGSALRARHRESGLVVRPSEKDHSEDSQGNGSHLDMYRPGIAGGIRRFIRAWAPSGAASMLLTWFDILSRSSFLLFVAVNFLQVAQITASTAFAADFLPLIIQASNRSIGDDN